MLDVSRAWGGMALLPSEPVEASAASQFPICEAKGKNSIQKDGFAGAELILAGWSLGTLVELLSSGQVSMERGARTPGMTSFSHHRFHVLDGMRGIAAIMVMMRHYHAHDPEVHPYVHNLLNNSYLAVDFFFVLSGFVVSHAYGTKLLSGMRAGDYLARRIGRLFPLMSLGLLIGLLACYLYASAGSAPDAMSEMLAATLSNLFFIPYLGAAVVSAQDSLSLANMPSPAIFPTDPPLWSIFFEMVASVAFIALIRLRRDVDEHLAGMPGISLSLFPHFGDQNSGFPFPIVRRHCNGQLSGRLPARHLWVRLRHAASSIAVGFLDSFPSEAPPGYAESSCAHSLCGVVGHDDISLFWKGPVFFAVYHDIGARPRDAGPGSAMQK